MRLLWDPLSGLHAVLRLREWGRIRMRDRLRRPDELREQLHQHRHRPAQLRGVWHGLSRARRGDTNVCRRKLRFVLRRKPPRLQWRGLGWLRGRHHHSRALWRLRSSVQPPRRRRHLHHGRLRRGRLRSRSRELRRLGDQRLRGKRERRHRELWRVCQRLQRASRGHSGRLFRWRVPRRRMPDRTRRLRSRPRDRL